jgi:hypothetical protein
MLIRLIPCTVGGGETYKPFVCWVVWYEQGLFPVLLMVVKHTKPLFGGLYER